ncbi:NepR family anti-sigma factor [Ancylobacter lacus]|uniref:NepR family anti-sigma factor n=1 Tax=Ancylobacter lacus TaxID=2579970 RepID=UPI003CCEDBFF
MSRDVQSKIGQHLRAMYDDVVRQGVPDRFLDLLSQLDEREGAAKGEKSDGSAGENER